MDWFLLVIVVGIPLVLAYLIIRRIEKANSYQIRIVLVKRQDLIDSYEKGIYECSEHGFYDGNPDQLEDYFSQMRALAVTKAYDRDDYIYLRKEEALKYKKYGLKYQEIPQSF